MGVQEIAEKVQEVLALTDDRYNTVNIQSDPFAAHIRTVGVPTVLSQFSDRWSVKFEAKDQDGHVKDAVVRNNDASSGILRGVF